MSVTEATGVKDLTREIQDALIEQVGRDLFRLWFGQIRQCRRVGTEVRIGVAAQFAMDRIASRYMPDLRRAVADVCGEGIGVAVELFTPAAAASSDPSIAAAEPSDKQIAGDAQAVDIAQAAEAAQVAGAAQIASDTQAAGAAQNASHGRASQSTQPTSAARSTDHRGASARASSSAGARPIMQNASLGPTAAIDQSARRRRLASWEDVVVGTSNKLAVTASKMVCDQPGSASPLFLWGNHGSGKSQLLEVIAGELRRRYRMRRVISMTAEEFTNDFIGSVTGSGLPNFRRRYRDVDALMIDDVQFLPGKPATSREMLYTIDSIVRSGKQMVFAADRPPMEIEGLGQDLGGRMSSGMLCCMNPLDREMRSEFLQRSCDAAGVTIDAGLLADIAAGACGDGRILSGIACRLKALHNMSDRQMTHGEVQSMLSDLLSIGNAAPDFADIQSAVCSSLGLPLGALQSKGQSRAVSQGRMLAMYLARQHTGATYGDIGEYFGKRSHSAVIAATRRVAGDLQNGKEVSVGNRKMPLKQMLDSVQTMLRTG